MPPVQVGALLLMLLDSSGGYEEAVIAEASEAEAVATEGASAEVVPVAGEADRPEVGLDLAAVAPEAVDVDHWTPMATESSTKTKSTRYRKTDVRSCANAESRSKLVHRSMSFATQSLASAKPTAAIRASVADQTAHSLATADHRLHRFAPPRKNA